MPKESNKEENQDVSQFTNDEKEALNRVLQ